MSWNFPELFDDLKKSKHFQIYLSSRICNSKFMPILKSRHKGKLFFIFPSPSKKIHKKCGAPVSTALAPHLFPLSPRHTVNHKTHPLSLPLSRRKTFLSPWRKLMELSLGVSIIMVSTQVSSEAPF
jgi:hypothetical protein